MMTFATTTEEDIAEIKARDAAQVIMLKLSAVNRELADLTARAACGQFDRAERFNELHAQRLELERELHAAEQLRTSAAASAAKERESVRKEQFEDVCTQIEGVRLEVEECVRKAALALG